MTTTAPDSGLAEFCEGCGRETRHTVHIQLQTENPDADQPKCSREPYRVSECRHCGTTTARRMNNA